MKSLVHRHPATRLSLYSVIIYLARPKCGLVALVSLVDCIAQFGPLGVAFSDAGMGWVGILNEPHTIA
jgi:hypothetical protein